MIRLITILFCVLLCQSGTATVWNMPAFDWLTASNYMATNNIQPGDTVNIPAGTNNWYATLPNFYGVTLAGAGTNRTVIVDETPITGNGLGLISMTSHPVYPTRLTALTITGGITNNYNTVSVQVGNASAAVRGVVSVYGSSGFRIDHCVLYQLTGKPITINNGGYGVIDHCAIPMYGGANAIEIFDGVPADNYLGDQSWATPYTYGGSNAVFVEDCYINSAFHFTAVDVEHGGCAVLRNNNFNWCTVYTHGSESSQRYRSARVVEVCSNTFNFGNTPYADVPAAVIIRGGTALIFGNCITNAYNVAELQNYRSEDNSPYFTPWFGATGLTGYDSNSPALLSGIASATSTNLVVSGANWTINQWVGCTVYNSNAVTVAGNSVNLIGMVYTNNANTMSFWQLAPGDIYQQNFNAGDPFVVHMVYPALDQPGRGYGTLMSNSVPVAQWSNEALEPIYSWGNICDTAGYGVWTGGALFYQAPNILVGRDFYNSPMPGYSPFVYPNPLTGITNSGGSQPGSTNLPYRLQIQYIPAH